MPSASTQNTSLASSGPGVEMVERSARLFKAGDYADKGISLTPDSLDAIVALSSQQQLIPLDFSWHGKSYDVLGPLGGIVGSSLRRDGDWIVGTARLPKAIDHALKCRSLSVRLDGKTKAITDVAVLPKGRVADAAFSGVSQMKNGDFCFAEGEMTEEPAEAPAAEPEEEQPTATTSVQAVLEALRGVGLDLPDDTTDGNLNERIVVAARAMASANKPEETPQGGGGETEHPSPVVMGTKSGGTMSDIKFSDPAVSLPLSLRRAYRKAYVERIQGLVNSRRITAKYANDTLAKHLGKSDKDFVFSVSDAGDVSSPVLDAILDGLEQLPAGSVLTGPFPETERRIKARGTTSGDVGFSLKLGEREEDLGAEFGDDQDEAKSVTAEMLKMSGGVARTA